MGVSFLFDAFFVYDEYFFYGFNVKSPRPC